MPARREYTAEDLAERLERQREQTRQRVARYRARQSVPVTPVGNADTVTVTSPALHARDDVRSTAPVTTIHPLSPPVSPTPPTAQQAPKTPRLATAVAAASKSGAVIDGLRAAGLCDQLSKRDHGAIKASGLSPEQIVEAFGAIARGEWGDAWLRTHLSVFLAVDRYPGFDAARRFPAAANGRAGAGRKSTGTRILEHYGYGTE